MSKNLLYSLINEKFLDFYVLQMLFSKDFRQRLLEIKTPHNKNNNKNNHDSKLS